ncbi:MAG: hypothetical protein ABJM99_14310 [Parasphingorhabdus sp.]
MVRTLFAFLIVALAGTAQAQSDFVRQIVTSDGPSSVSVTVYRDPNRASDRSMNLNYLNGYALITEQRTVTLPAGEVDLRFEGVAGGIIPQSAIVTGLAEGVLEKNRDAALLSPSALLNGHIGRGVTVQRTSAVTGRTEEYAANIRTDARNGVVIQTADGFEALRCTGLNEALVYPEVPQGLSAKPTLSVKTIVNQPTRATVTLSYLATGFDWQANYVADVSEDGETMNLFSWVTLANSDETSFRDAQTNAVAGQPNKGRDNIQRATGGAIALRCWPQATTSDIAIKRFERARNESRYRGQPLPAPMMAMEAESDMVALGSAKQVQAKQEELGDLKLYRIPVPVTVASKSQKQVAMFEKQAVPFKQLYETEVGATGYGNSGTLFITLRLQNNEQNSLGLALPAGKLVAFKEASNARLLLGEGNLDDKAIGEEVEIRIGNSQQVRFAVDQIKQSEGDDRKYRDFELTLTNALAQPASIELKLSHSDRERLTKVSKRLGRKDGKPLWKVTVPANGYSTLRYRVNFR